MREQKPDRGRDLLTPQTETEPRAGLCSALSMPGHQSKCPKCHFCTPGAQHSSQPAVGVNKCLQMNGWMDGRTDRRTDGRTDGWVGQSHRPALWEAKAWSVGRVRKATFGEHFHVPDVPPLPSLQLACPQASRRPPPAEVSVLSAARVSGGVSLNTRHWLCRQCTHLHLVPICLSFPPGYLLGVESWGILSLASPVPQTSNALQAYFF